MKENRRALGRGLEALIPAAEQPSVRELDIEGIAANPRQPRSYFDETALAELTESIAAHGILQPLLVAESDIPTPDGQPHYQLIAGERRLQAAKRAGLTRVPVVIRGADAEEMLELALIENIQRQDLGPLEQAAAYQQLAKEFALTQEQIATKVGKSRAAVANSLRLLNLPQPVRSTLAAGAITEGHARTLLALRNPEAQIKALAIITGRGLNVRQTERLIQQWDEPKHATPKRTQDPDTRELENVFRQTLGTKVSLQRGRKGGKLIIHFYSDDELQSIYDIVVRPE